MLEITLNNFRVVSVKLELANVLAKMAKRVHICNAANFAENFHENAIAVIIRGHILLQA